MKIQCWVLFMALGLLLVGCGGGYSSHHRIYPSDAFLARERGNVTVVMGQQKTQGDSRKERMKKKGEFLFKIVDWEDLGVKAKLDKGEVSCSGKSFTKMGHCKNYNKRIVYLRCHYPDYLNWAHNEDEPLSDCGDRKEQGIYGIYSDQSKPNSPESVGVDGGGNVIINSHNTTRNQSSYAPPIGECPPYWRGYSARVKWHSLWGWQCHYGRYVMTGSDPYPYGIPYR